MEYELKLKGGKKVVWDGKDGVDASWRYAEAHPGVTIIAWRNYPRTGIFAGVHYSQIEG